MLAMVQLMRFSTQSTGCRVMPGMVILKCYLKLLLGRLGIVVSADVAVYAKGSARPTGGIGAIALLIGPNAPLVFDDVRATFIDNAYDFYKPVMSK